MPQEGIPRIQSVLYQSPYSGCSWFSGWPRAKCISPPGGSTWPPASQKPPAMCVDRGRKIFASLQPTKSIEAHRIGGAPSGNRRMLVDVYPTMPPAGAILKNCKVAYNLHPIAGPSSKGPFTWRVPGTPYFTFSSGSTGANYGTI